MMQVPFIDLKMQNSGLKSEIMPLWDDILSSAQFIGGQQVTEFERQFARLCNVNHCISVSSGTDALRCILLAYDLKEGDEVITVPNSFIATAEAITQAGANVVFTDIDPVTYNMDISQIEERISSKTKGILPVHLYGQPADIDPICEIANRYGLWVIEDACQAHLAEYKGRRVGSLGEAAAFSFYPGKNLGAAGEAGAITTNDGELAQKIRMIRDHGQSRKYFHHLVGYNCRCDAIQAAILNVKLNYLAAWNQKRRKNAQIYYEELKDTKGIRLPGVMDDCLHVYHLFVVQVENRDAVAVELEKRGIHTGFHYPLPIHLQKAYQNLNIPQGSFPVAEETSRKLLSLPMYPELTRSQILHVSRELRKIVNTITNDTKN